MYSLFVRLEQFGPSFCVCQIRGPSSNGSVSKERVVRLSTLSEYATFALLRRKASNVASNLSKADFEPVARNANQGRNRRLAASQLPIGFIFLLFFAATCWHAPNLICRQPRHESEIPSLGS